MKTGYAEKKSEVQAQVLAVERHVILSIRRCGMAKWLERARYEILKTADRHAAVTAERTLTAVTAVPQPDKSRVSDDIAAVFAPFPADQMQAHDVSPLVKKPEYDSAECISRASDPQSRLL
jgi:hypothetical protein